MAVESKYAPGYLRYVFDPFEDIEFKDSDLKEEAAKEIADFIKEQVLSFVGDGKSPISGKAFKALSPAYAKHKKAEGSAPIPNLELTGDMLDALDTRVYSGGLIGLEVKGKEAEKADGHCKLTGRENEALPLRRFIPDENESFAKPIQQGIDAIVKKYTKKDEAKDEA